MIKTENECCGCELPCIYEACPFWAVTRLYCDECGEESVLYWWGGQQLCIACIEDKLERVEYDD